MLHIQKIKIKNIHSSSHYRTKETNSSKIRVLTKLAHPMRITKSIVEKESKKGKATYRDKKHLDVMEISDNPRIPRRLQEGGRE